MHQLIVLTPNKHIQLMRTTRRDRRTRSQITAQIDPATPLSTIEEPMHQLLAVLPPNEHIERMRTTRRHRRTSGFVGRSLPRLVVDLDPYDEPSGHRRDDGQLSIASEAGSVVDRAVAQRVSVVVSERLTNGQRSGCAQLKRRPGSGEIARLLRPAIILGSEFVDDHTRRRNPARALVGP